MRTVRPLCLSSAVGFPVSCQHGDTIECGPSDVGPLSFITYSKSVVTSTLGSGVCVCVCVSVSFEAVKVRVLFAAFFFLFNVFTLVFSSIPNVEGDSFNGP